MWHGLIFFDRLVTQTNVLSFSNFYFCSSLALSFLLACLQQYAGVDVESDASMVVKWRKEEASYIKKGNEWCKRLMKRKKERKKERLRVFIFHPYFSSVLFSILFSRMKRKINEWKWSKECMYVCMYVCTKREREREREMGADTQTLIRNNSFNDMF